MSIETRGAQYGARFGNWKAEEKLGGGSGGKSVVFSIVRDMDSRQERCAMKAISLLEEKGALGDRAEFQKKEYEAAASQRCQQAYREVQLMQQLRGNTNIVDYMDHKFVRWEEADSFGVDLVIRMEKLQDLRSAQRTGRFFSEQEILRIGRDICRALVICHGKDILHRDIKPENIFFNKKGDFKLGDFGIARIMSGAASSRASTGIGTLAYAAPEQFSGRYDHRVDIYSLGLVLYELANQNHLPFASSAYVSDAEIQLRLSGTPLPPPQRPAARNPYATTPVQSGNVYATVPAQPTGSGDLYATTPVQSGLIRIIMRACAFDREYRYASAEEMLRALEDAIAGRLPVEPIIPVEPPEVPQDPPKIPEDTPEVPGNKWLKPLLAVAALLVVALLAFRFLPDVFSGKPEETEGPETQIRETQGQTIQTEQTSGESEPDIQQAPQEEIPVATTQPTSALPVPTQPTPAETVPPVTDQREPNWNTESIMQMGAVVACGGRHTVVMLPDGTAIADGENTMGQCDVDNWTDLVAVSAGDFYSVGLRSDGRVYCTGKITANFVTYEYLDVSHWEDIIMLAAGDSHCVGLKSDGTVVAAGVGNMGQCDADELNDYANGRKIIAIAAGYQHTVALYSDGRVHAVGSNQYGQRNVDHWENVIAVYAGANFTMALFADGTVDCVSKDSNAKLNVSSWSDVAYLATGDYFAVAVTHSGEVMSAGTYKVGSLDLSGWQDVVVFGAGHSHAVAVTESGEILVTGNGRSYHKYLYHETYGS